MVCYPMLYEDSFDYFFYVERVEREGESSTYLIRCDREGEVCAMFTLSNHVLVGPITCVDMIGQDVCVEAFFLAHL